MVTSLTSIALEGTEDAGIIWISHVVNGRRKEEFLKPGEAKIDVLDHGLLYGGGIFEGINFYTINGKTGVLFLEEHLDRFYDGIYALRITPVTTKDSLKKRILETVEKSGLKRGYIRPVITRGVGKELGISALCIDPTLFIYVCPPPHLFSEEAYQKGLSVEISPNTRISASEKNTTRLKWLDYALNTEAKVAANKRGYNDAIMMVRMTVERVPDGDGGEKEIVKRYVSEGTASNVFFVDKEGVLKTPSLECNCLDGVTRKAIIDLAKKKGLTVEEGRYTENDLLNAKEVFYTGTAAGVIAITSINKRKIGEGREGEITRMLREAYNNEVIPNNLTPIREANKVLIR